MYARVARFEDGQADAMRRSAEISNSAASSRTPEGVPATDLLLLIDPDNGRACWVTLYENEEDMHTGHAALNQRTPPGDGLGRCTSVETYEVAVKSSY